MLSVQAGVGIPASQVDVLSIEVIAGLAERVLDNIAVGIDLKDVAIAAVAIGAEDVPRAQRPRRDYRGQALKDFRVATGLARRGDGVPPSRSCPRASVSQSSW